MRRIVFVFCLLAGPVMAAPTNSSTTNKSADSCEAVRSLARVAMEGRQADFPIENMLHEVKSGDRYGAIANAMVEEAYEAPVLEDEGEVQDIVDSFSDQAADACREEGWLTNK